VLYACDTIWWQHSRPSAKEFRGERWSSHSLAPKVNDDKTAAAKEYGLTLIGGAEGDGFSFDLSRIHYGDNSGFQAINLALHFGARKIWLLGFDMKNSAQRHFFGDHPPGILKAKGAPNYDHFVGHFDTAARMLPADVEIINATPDSALTCFPRGKL
jgi:hypothetical protein